MAILIRVSLVLVGIIIGLCTSFFYKNTNHNETMEFQHKAIYQETLATKAKVIENGNKLDILLNIATNSTNRDITIINK